MPEDVLLVLAPQISVNDDLATLVEWYVPDEGAVSLGAPLCSLETTKARFDVAADRAGHVLHLAGPGSEVKVKQPLALIGPSVDALKAKRHELLAPGKSSTAPAKATDRAAKLASELGVDLARIQAEGVIREEDVRRAASRLAAGSSVEQRGAVIIPPTPDEPGYVRPDFLKLIERDPAFRALSSDAKVYMYRSFGAQIGDNVKIGNGSIIIGRAIRLADAAEIGSDCYIKVERLVLGKMSVIGDRARISTREVQIGDMFFSGEDVLIGGGGAFGPRSSLRVGAGCLVSAGCVLNTNEPIVLGDEVGLSPNVQLFTHNHWQNILRGYLARHAPISVESGAYIAGNSLVAPGVRIGEGATVLANSVVAASVEPYAIVSGVPAKVVSRTNTNLTGDQKEQIVRRFMGELSDVLQFNGFDPADVAFVPKLDQQQAPGAKVVLTFEAAVAAISDSPVIFDLTRFQVHGTETRLSDEVRNFLRRRGIRFKPIYWRYRHEPDFYAR